jgi:osmotically inducible protein OsmC
MGFKRTATAHWEGDLKTGQGRMSTPQSGLFDGTRYSFNTRFGEEKGSNPEELLAAAHSSCFSMALSLGLAKAGTPAESIQTTAAVTFEPGKGVLGSHLLVSARVPGVTEEEFERFAEDARANCPISQALSIPITIEAELA